MRHKSNLHVVMYESVVIETLKESDVEVIVAAAALYNSKHDITGVLLYTAGRCVQILEGPKNEVQSLMKRIKKDARHHKVKVFINEPLPVRNFAEWSMGSVVGGKISNIYRLSLPKIFEFAVESYKRAR